MHLVTSHIGTDLDGLAAMVALTLLEGPVELGLAGSMDPVTTRFYQDHGAALAPMLTEAELRARLEAGPLDRLLVADTARRSRLGFIGDYVDGFAEVAAWDTHGSEDADLPVRQLADAGACVAPLVLQLAARGVAVTPEQAGLFLLGIHADTGHFTFPGTTEVDHQAAAHCLAWGAPAEWVRRYVPRGLDRHRLRLIEQMSRRVEFLDAHGQAVALLSLDLDDYEPDLAPLLDDLRRAEGWDTAFLLASDPRRTSVIGRSTGAVDVAAVLRPLGGGGHPEAASAGLRACPLPEARALLAECIEAGGRQLTAADLASDTVHTHPADATVESAAAAMHRLRINALPLVRDGGYVGLVSRRELDDALRHGLADQPVASVSCGPPGWVAPTAKLDEIRRVLLTRSGRLVLVGDPSSGARGVVTRTNVFRSAALDPPLAGTRRPPGREQVLAALKRTLRPSDQSLMTRIGDVAEGLGVRAFLVGGAVRDVLLGRTVEDMDLVILGDARAVGRATVEAMGGRLHVHDAFQTCSWTSPEGRKVDLSSARTESYSAPAALPDVARSGLRHDLLRRDFTVNAMAIEIGPSQAGLLIDPFGGQLDLRERVLRVLHGLSFHDDPTRAWRAARFAGRFDFHLAPGTQALLRQALRAGFVAKLSLARLGTELHRLLEEPQVARCVAMLREWHLLKPIHSALATDATLLERVTRVREAWARYQALIENGELSPGEPQWIALGWQLPTDVRRALSKLTSRVSGRTARWVAGPTRVREALHQLARASRQSDVGAALVGLEPAELVCVIAFARDDVADAVRWWWREGRLVNSVVTGASLIAAGASSGPLLGKALAKAQAVALDGGSPAAQREAAAAALRSRDEPG